MPYIRIEKIDQKSFLRFVKLLQNLSEGIGLHFGKDSSRFFDIHLFDVLRNIVRFGIFKNIGQHVRVQNAVQLAALRNR